MGVSKRLWQMGLEFWAEKSNTHSLFEHNIFGESTSGAFLIAIFCMMTT
jgi:hypothetical protein